MSWSNNDNMIDILNSIHMKVVIGSESRLSFTFKKIDIDYPNIHKEVFYDIFGGMWYSWIYPNEWNFCYFEDY